MTRNPTPGRVLAACIAIVAALTWQPVRADDFPSHPLRLVVPFRPAAPPTSSRGRSRSSSPTSSSNR
jgi:hypothetical protein